VWLSPGEDETLERGELTVYAGCDDPFADGIVHHRVPVAATNPSVDVDFFSRRAGSPGCHHCATA
jgi:hypothetical protein